MKNPYRVRFVAQAEVELVFDLEADNQQDGLATAHDLALGALPSMARVLSIKPETIALSTFDRKEGCQTVQPRLKSQRSKPLYLVQAFEGPNFTGPVINARQVNSLSEAKRILQPSQGEHSIWGSARVQDSFSISLYAVQAPRGGWEVEVYQKGIALPVQRITWLASREDAMREVSSTETKGPWSKIHIVDFSNRQKGPVIWKALDKSLQMP